MQAVTPQSFNSQGCFAIDYDFSTHRCYFFLVNVLQAFTANDADPPVLAPVPFYLHCIINAGVPQPSSQGLRPNPNVVHITLCESYVVHFDADLYFFQILITNYFKIAIYFMLFFVAIVARK